jgi:hypothetical protein
MQTRIPLRMESRGWLLLFVLRSFCFFFATTGKIFLTLSLARGREQRVLMDNSPN